MGKVIIRRDNVPNSISAANSTTVLLAGGATFTGAWENLIGYTSISVSTLGSIPTDGVLWFDVRPIGETLTNSVPFNRTDITSNPTNIPAIWNVVESEFRIRYVNGTTPQTGEWWLETKYSNGQQSELLTLAGGTINANTPVTVNKAVLTGLDDDDLYRDVKITRGGHLETTLTDGDLDFHAIVTPGGGLKIAEQTHLVGEPFGNAALNTTKWNIEVEGSGTQDGTGNGELSLDTGTTANSLVEIESFDVARFIPANYNTTHHAVTIPDGASYATDNNRKWGAFDANNAIDGNGIFYELRSGVWYVTHCLNGVFTRKIRSSWNGAGASTFPDGSITANVYEIEYNAGSIIFRVNGSVMHRENLLANPFTDDMHFPIGMSNANINGSIVDVSMKIRAAAIYTLGKGKGADRPNYISGTNAGIIIKTGPGHLGKVILARTGSGGGDAVIEIYDALSAVNQIGRIAIGGDDAIPIEYDIIFNTGLYIVITGNGTLGTTITFD